MTEPVGINVPSTGEGDWRKLPLAACPPASTLSGVASGVDGGAANEVSFVTDGLRRCLDRYDVEELERGRFGLDAGPKE